MFPYDKSQTQSNSRRTSTESKSVNMRDKQSSGNILPSIENTDTDYHHNDQIIDSKQDCEIEEKPQIFKIKYMVPSSLIIQEHQSQHSHEQSSVNYRDNSKGMFDAIKEMNEFDGSFITIDMCPASHNNQIDDTEEQEDARMQEDSDEIPDENDNPLLLSNQQKIQNLRLQEMENRVCESQLRCDAQRLIISKAEEEFKHLQEMNKIRLQEAKIRLKTLERNCANGRGNTELFDGI